MAYAPLVYAGPTISPREINTWLPRAPSMAPIRRGDLYRARLLGFDAFLILDGVFLEQLAISPREIVDVLRDGALVVGAASMGAIRAAECWPAGMRGVGAIYRLYKRGSLTSDDEVAVAFDPTPPFASVTVPLVNVRFAVSQAVRRGELSRQDAERLTHVARERHFTARRWPALVRAAGFERDDATRVLDIVVQYDLKRLDALRALKQFRAWVEAPNPACAPAKHGDPTFFSAILRPREADAATDHRHRVESLDFWRWLVSTGWYRRYVAPMYACEAPHADASDSTTNSLARWLQAAHDSDFARSIRAQIAHSGDAAALAQRFAAVVRARDWARTHDLQPEQPDWFLARTEIANNHGFRTWHELQTACGGDGEVWMSIERACAEFALVKRVRRTLFAKPIPREQGEHLPS